MNLLRKNKKGFTLVELLIVIVILGILAALILPRLLAQPEKARIGEAVNQLGAIRRAMITTADSTGSNLQTTCTSATTTILWNAIGVAAPALPAAGGTSFAYTCANNGGTDVTLTATRDGVNNAGNYFNSTITLVVGTGRWGVAAAGVSPYQIINSSPST